MNHSTSTAHSPTVIRRVPTAEALAVDAACMRFEAEWRLGGSPLIESFLDEVSGRARSVLLLELLVLELELRRETGDVPPSNIYLDRFPDERNLVEEAYQELKGGHQGPADESALTGTKSSSDSNSVIPPTRQVGDYEIIGELARGGMGVVYKARQISLNRLVALKMILAGQFATDSEVRRFLHEAEAVARLDHPHIVPIYEVGREHGHAFYAMKLVDGEDLARQISRFLGDSRKAAALLVYIAQAVEYAHRQDLVHRDLKPSNILIDAIGRPHITDFGLVKRTDGGASTLTHCGAVLGTPSFMSPEQATGAAVGPATDIYSLGAILYQLLTGRPPFRAATAEETLAQLLEQEPIPPRQIRPDTPRDLERVCLKCLEKNPEDRYQSASELAVDLERFLRGDGVQAGGSDPLRRLWRWARREPEYAGRLVAQSLILTLTQINFLSHPSPDSRIHWGVTSVEAIWLASAIVLRKIARRDQASDRVRMAWMSIDVTLLTGILGLLQAVNSSLVLGYALVIAASGLWNRYRLVWFTTAIAGLGYGSLAFLAWRNQQPTDSNHYPNIILPALVVLGFLVGQQVRRIRALSPLDILPEGRP